MKNSQNHKVTFPKEKLHSIAILSCATIYVFKSRRKQLFQISLFLWFTAAFSSCSNMSQDSESRTPGTYIDDLVLDLAVAERTIRNSDNRFKGSHIVVEVFNGNLLIVGQVSSFELKQKATSELRKLKNVRETEVHNYLQIAPPTTLLARTNDAVITTKVKAKLLTSSFSAKNDNSRRKIKVLTEDGIVYLMGIIRQEDSESVTSAVKSVYGVRKIVKLFNELN